MGKNIIIRTYDDIKRSVCYFDELKKCVCVLTPRMNDFLSRTVRLIGFIC